MIKIGKLTDYAIVVMGQLAKEGASAMCSATHLSEMTNIPEPTVAKVLKMLTQGALLESVRGAAGGYRLIKSADQISIAEIVTVLEGPIAIVSCVDGGDHECRIESTCAVKGRWTPVNDAIKAALANVSLAEIMGLPSCGKAYNFLQETPVN